MTQKDGPKEYKLNAQDLLQIPEDRFDDFLVDLKKWHGAARNTIKFIETIAKASNQPMPKRLGTLRWIDDGKHDGKIIIKQRVTMTPTEQDKEQL